MEILCKIIFSYIKLIFQVRKTMFFVGSEQMMQSNVFTYMK